MKGFLSKENNLYICICILIASYVGMALFLLSNEMTGILMFGLFVFVTLISLFFGTLIALVLCLLVFFAMGSVILYLTIQNVQYGGFYSEFVTMQNFFIYGTGLLITVLFAGILHDQVNKMNRDIHKLRLDLKQLATIDPYTTFDNAERMEIELQREINRTRRYGGEFTLLFLEIDHYFEFIKTYGYKEFEHLLKTIGLKVNALLRNSDRKFRYSDSKFAIILTGTSKLQVEHVIDKLNQQLKNHKLLNGKFITLTFHISFEEYNEKMKEISPSDFLQSVEKETIFYAL